MHSAHLSGFNGAAKEARGGVHEELVQWAVEGDVDGGAGLLPPPRPPCLHVVLDDECRAAARLHACG